MVSPTGPTMGIAGSTRARYRPNAAHNRQVDLRFPSLRTSLVPQPPHDPSPPHPHSTPVSYTNDDIRHLCGCWRLTDQQRRTLPLLLSWMVPKHIARAMGLSTSRVRNLIQEICKNAELHDGAAGIRKGAAELVARFRATGEGWRAM